LHVVQLSQFLVGVQQRGHTRSVRLEHALGGGGAAQRQRFSQPLDHLGSAVHLVIVQHHPPLGQGGDGFVVFVERGQRRITVNYAKRQQGRRMFAGQSSHLPLKLNMAGVIPPIFASSIILFPASMGSFFGQAEGMGWLGDLSTTLSPGQPIYALTYAGMIIFFCFFYTALVFNPKEIADNLKKSGAFIPGIRPGEQSARYIDNVVSRLTMAGAIYLTIVCLIPEFMIVQWNVPFYFGGTSLLIIVVVMMDLMNQVQSHLMSRQYESLMKKSNLTGGLTGGFPR